MYLFSFHFKFNYKYYAPINHSYCQSNQINMMLSLKHWKKNLISFLSKYFTKMSYEKLSLRPWNRQLSKRKKLISSAIIINRLFIEGYDQFILYKNNIHKKNIEFKYKSVIYLFFTSTYTTLGIAKWYNTCIYPSPYAEIEASFQQFVTWLFLNLVVHEIDDNWFSLIIIPLKIFYYIN